MDSEILRRLDKIDENLKKLDINFQKNLENQQSSQSQLDQKVSIMINKLNKIEILESSINSITSTLACIQENMEEVVRKVDRMETSLNSTLKHEQDEVKKSLDDFRAEATADISMLNSCLNTKFDHLESTIKSEVTINNDILLETKGYVNNLNEANFKINDAIENVTTNMTSKFDKMIKDINSYLDKLNSNTGEKTKETKCELIKSNQENVDTIGKESQFYGDKIERSLPSPNKYTFVFYLKDFESLRGFGHTVRSEPWYIKEINTSVRGKVELTTDCKLCVSLELADDSTSEGLPPVTANIQLNVKATLCKEDKNPIPGLACAELTSSFGTRTCFPDGVVASVYSRRIRKSMIIYNGDLFYTLHKLMVKYGIEVKI